MLQVGDHLRPPDVRFPAHAVGVVSADLERVGEHRRIAERSRVPVERLARDLAQADTFDLGMRAGEILLHERRPEPHRVEDLRAAIGLVGRDAHLGHDLEQRLADGLDVLLPDVLGRKLGAELRRHHRQRVEREIGVDRLRAVACERAELMDLVGLPRLHDEAHRRAQALADQVMVHGRGREQRRDRNPVRPRAAVGEDDDVVAARAHGLLGLRADHVDRRRHAGRALVDRIGDVDRDRGEVVVLDLADLSDALEILVGEDRLVHLEPLHA